MPALPPYIIEPIWEQFEALLPEHRIDHPLGCHRQRIPDRVVFEKLVQILVFGCAYERIADGSCSESTLRRRRDEWIELGLVERLRDIALAAYDRYIGLEPSEVAVDCCVTKAPCGGEKAGRSPVDRGEDSSVRWPWTGGASRWGPPPQRPTAMTRRSWLPRWTSPKRSGWSRRARPSTSTAATTPSPPGRACWSVGSSRRSPGRADLRL